MDLSRAPLALRRRPSRSTLEAAGQLERRSTRGDESTIGLTATSTATLARMVRVGTNTQDTRTRQQRHVARLKAQVFSHYGQRCACCGSTKHLSIDALDGDGRQQRTELLGDQHAGVLIYRWLVAHRFPPGWQTLCRRCNISKGVGVACRLVHGDPALPQTGSPSGLMTTSEVAAAFGVDRHTVTVWLRDGELAGRKFGDRWLADAADVQRLRRTLDG